jgi:hypothetical protein
MPKLSPADLRFCELADRWRDLYGSVAYKCRHGDFQTGELTRLSVLLGSLLDEIRKRRSDIDLRPLARLSEVDFKSPPRDGSLELDISNTTDIIGDVYTSIIGSSKPGDYLRLTNPSLIKRPIADTLTNNDWKILRALEDLGAVSRKRLTLQRRVTSEANTGRCDSPRNKASFKNLKNLKLIDAVPKCGTCVTDDGLAILANHETASSLLKKVQ